jgi:hypothetical protein
LAFLAVVAALALIASAAVELKGRIDKDWEARTEVTPADWRSLVVDEPDLDRWAAYESQYLPTSSPSYGDGTNNVFARTLVAAYERVFISYPGPVLLRVTVTEERTAALAQGVASCRRRMCVEDARFDAPKASYRMGKDSAGARLITVDFAKGRVAAHVVVVGPPVSAEQSDWDTLIEAAIKVANAQYRAIPKLSDVAAPGNIWSTKEEKILLWLSELTFVVFLLLLLLAAPVLRGLATRGWWDAALALIPRRRRSLPPRRATPVPDPPDRAMPSEPQQVRQSAVGQGPGLGQTAARPQTLDLAGATRRAAALRLGRAVGIGLGICAVLTIEYFVGSKIPGYKDSLAAEGVNGVTAILALAWGAHVARAVRIPLPGGQPGRRAGALSCLLVGWAALAALTAALNIWTSLTIMWMMPAQATGDEYATGLLRELSVPGLVALLVLALTPAVCARRATRRKVLAAVEEDERRPVLLLRSFADDPTAIRVHHGNNASNLERAALGSRARFEEWLAWKLWQVGPVVAVARPGAKATRPVSAARNVPGDKDWGRHATEAAFGASLVVVVLDRSPTIFKEVEFLARSWALPKTVFVLPPVPLAEARRRLSVLAVAMGWEPRAVLGAVPPGHCALAVKLDRNCHPVVLVSAARTDLSYRTAVEASWDLSHDDGRVPGLPKAKAARWQAKRAGWLTSGRGTTASIRLRLGLRGLGWRHAALVGLVVVAAVVLVHALRQTPPAQPQVRPGQVVAAVDLWKLSAWDGGAVALGAEDGAVYRINEYGVQALGDIPAGASEVAARGDRVAVSWKHPVRIAAYDLAEGRLSEAWSSEIPGITGTDGLTLVGDYVVAASPATDAALVLRLEDGKIHGEVPVGPMPRGAAAWGGVALVAVPALERLQTLDPAKLELGDPVRVGVSPSVVRVEGDNAWVVSVSGERVVRVSLTGEEAPLSATVPGPVAEVAGAGDIAVVPTSGTDGGQVGLGLARVDLATGETLAVATNDLVGDVAATPLGLLARAGGALVRVPPEGPLGADLSATTASATSWAPDDPGWTAPIIRQAFLMDHDLGCGTTMAEQEWNNAEAGIAAVLDVAACDTAGTAFAVAQRVGDAWASSGTPGQPLFGLGSDSLFTRLSRIRRPGGFGRRARISIP